MNTKNFPLNDEERNFIREGRLVSAIKSYRTRYETHFEERLGLGDAKRIVEDEQAIIRREMKRDAPPPVSDEEKAKTLELLVKIHLDVAAHGLAARIGVSYRDVIAQFAFEAARQR